MYKHDHMMQQGCFTLMNTNGIDGMITAVIDFELEFNVLDFLLVVHSKDSSTWAYYSKWTTSYVLFPISSSFLFLHCVYKEEKKLKRNS